MEELELQLQRPNAWSLNSPAIYYKRLPASCAVLRIKVVCYFQVIQAQASVLSMPPLLLCPLALRVLQVATHRKFLRLVLLLGVSFRLGRPCLGGAGRRKMSLYMCHNPL